MPQIQILVLLIILHAGCEDSSFLLPMLHAGREDLLVPGTVPHRGKAPGLNLRRVDVLQLVLIAGEYSLAEFSKQPQTNRNLYSCYLFPFFTLMNERDINLCSYLSPFLKIHLQKWKRIRK